MDKPFANNEYITELYKNGFTEGYNYLEAFYIAKYLYWVLGFGKQKTKTELIEYCAEHDQRFNPITARNEINKIIGRAMNKKPNHNKDIVITRAELSQINTIKNYRKQKILFSILVASKRVKFDDTGVQEKKDYIGYRIHNNAIYEICNKIGLKLSFPKTMTYMQEFVEMSFLEPVRGNDYVKILFANDDSKPEIEVLGNENAWDVLNNYHGGEQIYCLNCEKRILKKSSGHKYCEECKKLKQLESGRKRIEKFRYNKK